MPVKKIVRNKQEILAGSSLLSVEGETLQSRNEFMIEHMADNKAFIHAKETYQNIQPKILLKKFQTNYRHYRQNWSGQPRGCINQKLNGEELLKNGRIPLCVDVETASICDLACDFCYRESLATPDKIIKEELYKNIIDQAAEIGVPSVKLNWRGEPLLNPKLYKFIEYAKKRGILEVIINTNATHLNEKTSERLIDAGLDFMIYSFDGGTKKTYEMMRPGRFKKNKFEDVYNNIINFYKIRERKGAKFPRTKIQMILTKDTYDEQDSFFKLFNDFVDEVSVTQYSERGGNFEDLNSKEKIQYSDICERKNLPKGTYFLRESDGKLKVSDSRLPCEQPYQRLLVTYDGRVAMCCYDWGAMHPVGYVSSDSFEDSDADKKIIMDKIIKGSKGFELMSKVKMPPKFNQPKQIVQTIAQIWEGYEISKVRQSHLEGNIEDVKICKKCPFKDTYNWVS